MAGNYHYSGDFNSDFTNNTNGHFSGNFTDPTGAVTGCTGVNYPSQSLNTRELSDMSLGQSGGQGYGFALEQPDAGFNRIPDQTSYGGCGINSDENLDASKQYNPSTPLPVLKGGGKKHRKLRGGSSLIYYGFDGKNGENLSEFAGSGYPPITVASQNGGRKRRGRRMKSHKRKHSSRHRRTKHKLSRSHKSRRHRTHRKLGLRRKKTSKLMRRLIGGKSVYKGGYSQFMGDQAFSQGYELGGPITPSTSALANPIPIKPYNNCSDPFGPK
jgi:hypothetical protein